MGSEMCIRGRYSCLNFCEWSDIAQRDFQFEESGIPYAYDSGPTLKVDPKMGSRRLVVDTKKEPQYAIADLGCTRSMASKVAVNAFLQRAWYLGVRSEWKPCNTKMSFANSETTTLKVCCCAFSDYASNQYDD